MESSELSDDEQFFVYFTAILSGVLFIATVIRIIIFFIKKASIPAHLKYQCPGVVTHLAQLALIVSLIVIACVVSSNEDPAGAVVAFVVIYIIYIICIEISPQYSAMRNMRSCNDCAAFARDMRATGPTLSFSIECYHFRTVQTDKDSTREEKVVTYSNTFSIPIPYWSDDTPPLFVPTERPFVHVKTRNTVYWMHNSLHIINKIQRNLYKEYKYRDDHCSIQRKTEILGLIPEIMVKTDESYSVPFALGFMRHILMLLGFGLPVAYHIATTAAVERFIVIKKASLEAPVVDAAFCQEYNIPYASVRPQAPVYTSAAEAQQPPMYDETQGPAVTPPCYYNPYPLIINDVQGYNQYYQTAMMYDQYAQQQQSFFANSTVEPSAPEIDSDDTEEQANLLRGNTFN